MTATESVGASTVSTATAMSQYIPVGVPVDSSSGRAQAISLPLGGVSFGIPSFATANGCGSSQQQPIYIQSVKQPLTFWMPSGHNTAAISPSDTLLLGNAGAESTVERKKKALKISHPATTVMSEQQLSSALVTSPTSCSSPNRRARATRPKVVEGKGSIQCQGINRKKGTQCKNAALMEYIGPRPVYCAEHIELDPASLYEKCNSPYQKDPKDNKGCKEVVLKEFGYCYKHFGDIAAQLIQQKNVQQLNKYYTRTLELAQQLEREAASAKKKDCDLYQRKNKLIPKFQEMKKVVARAVAIAEGRVPEPETAPEMDIKGEAQPQAMDVKMESAPIMVAMVEDDKSPVQSSSLLSSTSSESFFDLLSSGPSTPDDQFSLVGSVECSSPDSSLFEDREFAF